VRWALSRGRRPRIAGLVSELPEPLRVAPRFSPGTMAFMGAAKLLTLRRICTRRGPVAHRRHFSRREQLKLLLPHGSIISRLGDNYRARSTVDHAILPASRQMHSGKRADPLLYGERPAGEREGWDSSATRAPYGPGLRTQATGDGSGNATRGPVVRADTQRHARPLINPSLAGSRSSHRAGDAPERRGHRHRRGAVTDTGHGHPRDAVTDTRETQSQTPERRSHRHPRDAVTDTRETQSQTPDAAGTAVRHQPAMSVRPRTPARPTGRCTSEACPAAAAPHVAARRAEVPLSRGTSTLALPASLIRRSPEALLRGVRVAAGHGQRSPVPVIRLGVRRPRVRR
jgi:hypothetical protein